MTITGGLAILDARPEQKLLPGGRVNDGNPTVECSAASPGKGGQAMRLRATCPLCDKPAAREFKPFCSRGCKDRDLLNWLGEAYRVPARSEEEEGGSGLDSTPQA